MIILIEDTARRGFSTALSISRAEGDAVEERIRTVIAPETQKTMLLAKKKTNVGRGMVHTCKKVFVSREQAERHFVEELSFLNGKEVIQRIKCP